jgi:hypothetical protein
LASRATFAGGQGYKVFQMRITTNQAAIIRLFKIMSRYVGNLPAMPGVFPD